MGYQDKKEEKGMGAAKEKKDLEAQRDLKAQKALKVQKETKV